MKRILIVDDEESIRLLLRRILESNPALEMTLAASGDEALKLAAERPNDLILLDLLMPGLGGIEALTRIRGGSVNKKTPVLVVSVLADPSTRMVCQSLGVRGFLAKPIDRRAVIDAVNEAINASPGGG